MRKLMILGSLILAQISFANYEPDWSNSVEIKPGTNRENIYNLTEDEFHEITQEGLKHALVYPVTISGLFVPYEPMVNFFKEKDNSLMKMILAKIGEKTTGIDSVEGLYKWLGLNKYNDEDSIGIYRIPYPDGFKPDYYMGASIIDTKWGKGLTFSCATCHSANLFGTSVMGLTNKTVKANRLFEMAKKFVPFVPAKSFQKLTGATDQEVEMLMRTKKNLGAVGVVKPQVLGLDTSLPQVALSLARRGKDEYATKSKFYEAFPRRNALSHEVADSKPAVWWNLKYKTRWLSDGSIVAGNPIFTNFLWNELGRGTDLKELEEWMRNSKDTVRELTAAAFSTKPPRWTDFFPENSIDIAAAKRGEGIFKNRCQKCHGQYSKGWSSPNADSMNKLDLIKTVNVKYHKKTPVKNVGTDPGRFEGTKAFAKALNDLQISKWMKTVVKPQKGYVPPPLDGIWSRWPYLHNNSIPTLCDLMTHPSKRTKTFYQIPAESKTEDFDSECVGFPVGNKVPKKRRTKEAFFNTAKKGLRNTGHFRRIFTDKQGNEILTSKNKKDLIMFLKTL